MHHSHANTLTYALIPVKRLAYSKSRLASVLSPPQRAQLTLSLLRRTLRTLRQVTAVAGLVVVSRDPIACQLATAYGAAAVSEREGGSLNEAVAEGARWAAINGAAQVLILPADLPFLERGDVMALLAAAETAVEPRSACVLSSDRRGQGTNALLLPTGVDFHFQYGAGSFQRHLAEAQRVDLAACVVDQPGLQFDLDSEQDWWALNPPFQPAF